MDFISAWLFKVLLKITKYVHILGCPIMFDTYT